MCNIKRLQIHFQKEVPNNRAIKRAGVDVDFIFINHM